MKLNKILTLIGLFTAGISLKAQNVDDAMRYSNYNGVISARAGALGASFIGIADDFSALFYNSAGLALVPKGEFSIGFVHNRFKTNSRGDENVSNDWRFFENSLTKNSPSISHIGFVSPFKIAQKNASIAIGYYLESDFALESDYSHFSPNSSYINYLTNVESDIDYNIPYQLNLAAIKNSQIVTPIIGNLQQKSELHESGSLNSVAGAIAVELTPSFSVGMTLMGKWGTYNYSRLYQESDLLNYYTAATTIDSIFFDLNRFTIDEHIKQTVSGISCAFSFQSRLGEMMRIGGQIKVPTYYDIEESFSQNSSVLFDNGDTFQDSQEGDNSYSLTTPFVYSLGMSFHNSGLTVSAGIEYTDNTTMEFSSDMSEVAQKNFRIARDLAGQTMWSVGAEYMLPVAPLVVRASYSQLGSPYANENVISSSDAKSNIIAFGLGFFPSENIMIDLLYRFTEFKKVSTQDNTYFYINKISPSTIGISMTYRF